MELSLDTFGSGPRRALLLHGISSNAAGWWRVGPALAALGYQVTAPDLRGHGMSPPGDSYRLADHAADVAELGGGWDLVLGHSMGGAVALLLVDDEFTKRLILEDPALLVPQTEESRQWLTRAYEPPISAGAIARANPRWHPEDARIKADALLQSGVAMVEQAIVDNPDWNVMAQLLELAVPTLLLGGDPNHGALVPGALGESIAAQVPSIEYQMVTGAGHSMHRDEFDAFMHRVESWLAT